MRSLRQRFELNPPPASAPTTPHAKRPSRSRTRAPTKTQEQLAAFLKQGADRKSSNETAKLDHDLSQKDPKSANVGSLIQKWSIARTEPDRVPLAERHLQQHDPLTPAVDSVDTFGSSTAELDHSIPKTDPGRLESYAALAVSKNPTPQPVTHDQSVKEMVTKGLNPPLPPTPSPQSIQPTATPLASHVAPRKQSLRKTSPPPHSHSPSSDSTDPQLQLSSQTDPSTSPSDHSPEHQQDGDWGAGDVYIRELFAEAEDTAERAVQCDEMEQYFEAFELYWVVVDLYYKVIPFLTREEGGDVHERIKMYTRRCEAIREAFEDDPEGQDEIQVRIADATVASAQKEEQIQESFNAANWTAQPEVENVENVGFAFPPQADVQSAARPQPSNPLVPTEARHHEAVKPNDTNTYELPRTRFPDYTDKPIAPIPEAPRGPPALSASTKAHRNSLSRPISRSAVRASTSSVSRERVAEMQERVNVMQECLNNFTVKRKHLGPARALELHVTTLNANTFGDLKKLEPLAPELEHKWATELEVLLSMLQEIKEVRPGVGYGLRDDIARHLPALERCDRSVRGTMRSFAALAGHVRYVERETAGGSAKEGRSRRRWWVKVPVVEKGGLPSQVRKIVEEAEKEMRGVFKVCHEINVEVVKSMPVPQSFVTNLPRHARALIPRELKEGLTTWDMFKISDYMKDRNLWHKEAAKEITSSLEKVALIWESKTLKQSSFISRTLDLRRDRMTQAMNAFRRCQNAIRDLRREW